MPTVIDNRNPYPYHVRDLFHLFYGFTFEALGEQRVWLHVTRVDEFLVESR